MDADAVSPAARSAVADRDIRAVGDFLIEEAEILDEARYSDWLALLAPDVRYRVFAPVIRMAGASVERVPLFEEDFVALRSRVLQLENPELTVAENPRSIDRRFVTNVRVRRGAMADAFEVRSNLLIRRARGLDHEPQLLSATRLDVVRRVDGALRLAARIAQVDDAIIRVRSLSLFF